MRKRSKFLLLLLSALALFGLALLVVMAWPLSITSAPALQMDFWFYLGLLSIFMLLLALLYLVLHVLTQPLLGEDLLDKKEGGSVRVSAEALRSVAERTAKLRPEVAEAQAKVFQDKKETAVNLFMDLVMRGDKTGGLSVRNLAEDIKQDINREIQNFSGYPLKEFHLNVTMDDAEKLPVQALADSGASAPFEPNFAGEEVRSFADDAEDELHFFDDTAKISEPSPITVEPEQSPAPEAEAVTEFEAPAKPLFVEEDSVLPPSAEAEAEEATEEPEPPFLA